MRQVIWGDNSIQLVSQAGINGAEIQ